MNGGAGPHLISEGVKMLCVSAARLGAAARKQVRTTALSIIDTVIFKRTSP